VNNYQGLGHEAEEGLETLGGREARADLTVQRPRVDRAVQGSRADLTVQRSRADLIVQGPLIILNSVNNKMFIA